MARWYCEDSQYTQISDREKKIRDTIVAIMKKYKIDMRNEHWGSPNMGVPDDDFEDVADEIMKAFEMNDDQQGKEIK